MMERNAVAAVVWVATLGLSISAFAILSEPVLVDTTRGDDRHWMTVFTNEVPLVWAWNTNASSARLESIGMNGSFATNFTSVTSNCLWRVFASETPSAEDVYDVTLTFYKDGGTVVEAMTSRLAVVVGAFGGTAVNAVSNSPVWQRVKENVVIPYDAVWSEGATNAAGTQLVIAKTGGAVQTNTFDGVSGYTGWKLRNSGWGYGVFNLDLTYPASEADPLSATLLRASDGTAVSLH